jgi:hypothetical protein
MEHLRRSYASKPLANHKPHNAAERALLRLPIGLTHHLAMTAMTQPLVVENMVERALLHLQVPIGLTHYLVTMAMTQPLMDGNVVEQAPLHLPIGLMHHLVMMVTTQPGHLVDGNMVEFEQVLLHLPIGLAHHLQYLHHHQIRNGSKHLKFTPEFFSAASPRRQTMKTLSSAVFSKRCLSMKHISLLITHTLHKSCSSNG